MNTQTITHNGKTYLESEDVEGEYILLQDNEVKIKFDFNNMLRDLDKRILNRLIQTAELSTSEVKKQFFELNYDFRDLSESYKDEGYWADQDILDNYYRYAISECKTYSSPKTKYIEKADLIDLNYLQYIEEQNKPMINESIADMRKYLAVFKVLDFIVNRVYKEHLSDNNFITQFNDIKLFNLLWDRFCYQLEYVEEFKLTWNSLKYLAASKKKVEKLYEIIPEYYKLNLDMISCNLPSSNLLKYIRKYHNILPVPY